MLPIAEDVCGLCGERLFSPYAVVVSEEPRCGLCRRIQPVFVRAAAYGSYEDGLRELIHLLKYGGVRPAAKVLGRMLAEAIAKLENEFGAQPVLVVPVPLYRGRHHQRGFNQAELVAGAAIRLSGSGRRLHLRPDILKRKRDTTSQTGLTSHQRRENLRGAFEVTRSAAIKGRELLVVDDVYTTGATVSECTRVLRRAGASKVWVVTVARTLKITAQAIEIGPRDLSVDDEWPGAKQAPLVRVAG